MIKVLVFSLIFFLILSTSLIKKSTKDLDDKIYSIKENILFLENRFYQPFKKVAINISKV